MRRMGGGRAVDQEVWSKRPKRTPRPLSRQRYWEQAQSCHVGDVRNQGPGYILETALGSGLEFWKWGERAQE